MKQDNAFTGLEAAIVLIAFVVVAAVFSYVLLGAGFFATQKAQEVTYAGIQQTTSNMYLIGQVYGEIDPDADDELISINFKMGVPEGAQPQDVAQMRFILSVERAEGAPIQLALTDDGVCPQWPAVIGTDLEPGQWCYYDTAQKLSPTDTSKLYPGEKMDFQIATPGDDDAIGFDSTMARSFTLEIKPRVGASYVVSKTLSTGFTHGPLY
jgi:flagellin FlaB